MSKRPQENLVSKTSRRDYERRPLNRLKRFTKSYDPEHVAKRQKYAAQEGVKQRRQELNRQRRALSRALITLLKNGELLLKGGVVSEDVVPLALSYNKIVMKDSKNFAQLSKDKIYWYPYKDEVDLASDFKVENNVETEEDKEFKVLLSKFLNGDPEVMNMLSKKKVTTESTPTDYEKIRSILKEKTVGFKLSLLMDGDSDNSTSDE